MPFLLPDSVRPGAAARDPHDYQGLSLHAGYGRLLVAHLRAQHLAPERLYPAGTLARIEDEASTRVPLAEWLDWMETAEQATGEPDLCLRLTEASRPWHAGVLGFAMMTSPSIQEVGHLLARFQRLLTNVYRIRVSEDAGHFRIRLLPGTAVDCPRLAALLLGTWAWRMRWFTGLPGLRFDVNLDFAPPEDTRAYTRTFGGVVAFGQAETSLVGDRDVLSLPVLQRDPGVHGMLCSQVAVELERLASDSSDFAVRVRRKITQQLGSGHVSLEAFAAVMNMAPRTLQERLEPSGHTFRSLLDGARHTLAKRQLAESRASLTDIALALGFTNQCAFQHAFKRWTGITPGEWRRRHGGG
jgi:AraC-like DNA-binding protein